MNRLGTIMQHVVVTTRMSSGTPAESSASGRLLEDHLLYNSNGTLCCGLPASAIAVLQSCTADAVWNRLLTILAR